MKKTIGITSTIFLALLLAGCNNAASPMAPPADSSVVVSSSSTDTVPAVSSVVVPSSIVALSSVVVASSSSVKASSSSVAVVVKAFNYDSTKAVYDDSCGFYAPSSPSFLDMDYSTTPYYNGAVVNKADEKEFLHIIKFLDDQGTPSRMTCTVFESKGTYDAMLASGLVPTEWALKWNWIKGP